MGHAADLGARTGPEVRAKVAQLLRDGKPNAAIQEQTGASADFIKKVAADIGVYRGSAGKILTKADFDAWNRQRLASLGKTPKAPKAATATAGPRPQRKRHVATDEEIAQVRALWAAGGQNGRQIAEATGLTESIVQLYNPNHGRGDQAREQRVLDLLGQGLSQSAIITALGEQQTYVSRTYRRWLAQGGNATTAEPSASTPTLPTKIATADDYAATLRRLIADAPGQVGWLAVEVVNATPEVAHSGEPGFRAQLDDARLLMRDDSRFERLPGGLWRLAADDAPLTEREESNKIKLLRLIVQSGTFDTEAALTRRCNSAPDIRIAGHEMTHILHALRKQGKVTFHHAPSGPNGEKLTRIAATANGKAYIRSLGSGHHQNEKPEPDNGPYVGAAHGGFIADTLATGRGSSSFRRKPRWTEAQHAAVETPVEEAAAALAASDVPDERLQEWADRLAPAVVGEPPSPPTPPAPAAAPPAPEYPHLDALRKRVADGAAARARAEAYLAAAALLEPFGTDTQMVDALVTSANDLGEKTRLSALEAEYLAYAEAHPNGK